jgi:hypothetical protein
LSEESVVVICPNPKCRREIGKPILLTVLSVTPPKEYEACPYCFTDLTPEPQTEKEEVPEPTVEAEEMLDEEEETASTNEPETSVLEKVKAGPSFLKRVRSWIPRAGSAQEESQKPEEPEVAPVAIEEEKTTEEEPETEPYVGEESEEAPKTEPVVEAEPEEVPKVPETELTDKKEDECSGCPDEFGYLANRPPDTPIPSQCLVCPKMVDCMLCPRESDE